MMVFFWIIEGAATYCESFVCYYLGNTLFDKDCENMDGSWLLF